MYSYFYQYIRDGCMVYYSIVICYKIAFSPVHKGRLNKPNHNVHVADEVCNHMNEQTGPHSHQCIIVIIACG